MYSRTPEVALMIDYSGNTGENKILALNGKSYGKSCLAPSRTKKEHVSGDRFTPCLFFMAVKSCQNCGKAPTRANPLKNCSRCHDATYCSGECQHKDWPKHKNNCANILAVHLFPAGNEALMKEENTQKVFIDQNHPVFTAGTVAPVSQLIGIPLLLYRIGRLDEYRENNRPVTYLMINGDNGFADLSWQDNVGKVLVVRKDRKPLKPQTLKLIWKFCHLSACGYHFFNKVDVQDRYNPNLFRRWCELYLYDEYTNREQTEWQELFLKFETDPEDPF